ncbi:hypothetical protein BXT84_11970 [Sulfobacillus thermotolerans]|uniref:Thymidylate synthase n=1 Tax=Sulfobacillus thermotolerans TaxID=338644 RepID=A0ABN5H1F0_9FIRM|nr:hypothetical protein BXT84_11970 [Sulfobacillus thermotolerans]
MPQIYSVTNVPPEVLAYGMAKYSRSRRSLRQNLLELSEDKAAQFLNTFYFDYGHASIADLAHVALAVEDISLLAAMEIVDEPLWDGQERSTRYQNFDHAPYYRPSDAKEFYDEATQELFALYHSVLEESLDLQRSWYPKPEEMDAKAYERIIRARALDIARYCLPLNALTSLGQITNARTLEQQIARLLSSSLPEVQDIALQMKAAVTEKPPVSIAPSTDASHPAVPTLIKYAVADSYRQALRALLEPIAAQVAPSSMSSMAVDLIIDTDPLHAQIAQLLYPFGQASYRQYLAYAASLSRSEQTDLLNDVFARRGPHDEWPAFMRQAPLTFDLTMDVGAFRDFNRHRRVYKSAQNLSLAMSYAIPAVLGGTSVQSRLTRHFAAYYERLAAYAVPPQHLPYLLPLAHKRRVLMRMDITEAAYIIELRSRSQGHFSYRQLAWDMYQAIEQAQPALARYIRVTPPDTFNPFQR